MKFLNPSNIMTKLPNEVTQPMFKFALKAKETSPQTLFAVGVVGLGASLYFTGKATLQAGEVIDTHNELIEMTEKAEKLDPTNYTKSDKAKDVALVWSKSAVAMLKLYTPAIASVIVTVAAFGGAQHILNTRNIALAGAYKALEEGFNKYRDRVVEEFGEEKDRDFIFNLKDVKEKVKTEDGKTKTVSKKVKVDDSPSMYARIFDELNPNFQKDRQLNRMYIHAQQDYMNNLLRVRGYVLLNDVYDALGFERTKAGCFVGWHVNAPGDNFIDFGLFDPNNERKREFVNGYEDGIVMDFNVNGIITEYI